VDSLLHDESDSTMSILQDPVRPLDPSSQQEFVERGREAEAEGQGRSRSRKLVVWPPFGPRPGPGTRGRNGLVRVGVRTDGELALKPCRSTT
jgi:hypothetical protein